MPELFAFRDLWMKFVSWVGCRSEEDSFVSCCYRLAWGARAAILFVDESASHSGFRDFAGGNGRVE